MYGSTTNDLIDLMFYGGLITFTLVGSIYRYYRRKKRAPVFSNAPILLAYYSEGAKEMLMIHKGKTGDMDYQAMLILGNQDGIINPGQAILFRVELPFTTKVHLLGIPKKSGATQLNPANGKGIMERVSLEGDYDNYFTLFTEKNMQSQSRYVLDPKAMVFTVDFCQSHNWEIIDDELYFVRGRGSKSAQDPTLMYDDVVKFVEEIRPAIAEAPSRLKLNLHPKHRELLAAHNYKCPACQAGLVDNKGSYRCPSGHGLLLRGFMLPDVKQGKIVNPHLPDAVRQLPKDIDCPVCGYPMARVPYAGSKTIIDSCVNCPFRWLDAGELHKTNGQAAA